MRPLALSLLVIAAGCTQANNHHCDPGTHSGPDGNCVPDVVCGAGTTAKQGVCLPDTPPPVTCGPGTHADGSQCLPDLPGGGLTCGTGTHAVDGACVPDSTTTCGLGTHLADGVCLPDSTTSCGAGTHLVNGVCLPDETCGAGTHDDGKGSCVPIRGSDYQVRVSVTQVGADGYSAIPVFVIGTNADGTPASDTVLLTTSIPGEGTLAPSTVKLASVGNTVYFTPCNSAQNPACLGTFTINLSLASDPTVVVAKSPPITLTAPAGVGSDSPCLAGGNVIFFNGDSGDYIHPGMQTITQGTWSQQSSATHVEISLNTDQANGLFWYLDFDSSKLNASLDEQVYEGATRYPFEAAGEPGLDVSGDGRGCNMLSGRFQIEDLTMNGSSLQSFTATFEQHCENGSAALRGCVHWQQ